MPQNRDCEVDLEFRMLGTGSKCPVKCRHCPEGQGKYAQRNPVVMRGHLDVCKFYKPPPSEKTIEKHVDATSPEEMKKLQFTMAQSAYQDGRPFTIWESESMKKAFKILRPSFVPPNRHDMATYLLTDVYKESRKEVMAIIENLPFLCFTIDSWADLNDERWINLCLVVPNSKTSFFINAQLCEHHHETAANIVEWVVDMWEECKIPAEKIVSLTTDTCTVMKSVWKTLRAIPKYHHVLGEPCLAHVLQLAVCDLLGTDAFKTTIAELTTLASYFSGAHLQLAEFRRIQKEVYGKHKVIINPGATCWGTHYGLIESIIRTRLALVRFAQNREFSKSKNDKVKELDAILLNREWWNKLLELREVLRPITWTLKRFDSDDLSVGEVRELWVRLELKLKRAIELGALKAVRVLQERWEYLGKQAQYLYEFAYLLNPQHFKYNDSSLDIKYENEEHERKFYEWIRQQIGEEGEAEFKAYLGKTKMFSSRQHLYEERDPIVFWGLVTRITTILGDFALRVLTMPSTSTASERNWSCFGKIYSKLRNRLKPTKAFMLTYIYVNYRALNGTPLRVNPPRKARSPPHNRVEIIGASDDDEEDDIVFNLNTEVTDEELAEIELEFDQGYWNEVQQSFDWVEAIPL
eukprot:TRINITY_DN3296_c0_g2_i4.p1 TRINITY_DN3296_c0_g2~~TRINITY_DN3296_c0_g2_i4.p1  ORF type:complete len:636 (-),score=107.02 TRINITY_DN3296_c0_g2_i4:289-2196(-)